ncbi:alpha/beta hydrolase [Streptomyces caniscabiei]|uniref:alpha/beta hydrolase n=1 Tax=Streptomyces caniscabiei TaxID=2746961 RepID=UPI001CE07A86|nr:alpha/beta hydrolase [Streptomyces caniscabiei]MDX3511673.1 alpha/beta hydrolase [Streptomyces caniscabiei]MDX3719222.1 alpha/beta hydrolase [Streptomyces caniscabiei]WEO29634.1 alpha/beta hydrolase [Streptomyces caniscabiei]
MSSPELFVEDFSAAQVDPRIKAVATVVMYDISRVAAKGFHDTLTDETRRDMLDALARQRYADFEGGASVLTLRGAPIGFDEETDAVGREFGEFYSTPRGYHPNSITQFTMTSLLPFMNPRSCTPFRGPDTWTCTTGRT